MRRLLSGLLAFAVLTLVQPLPLVVRIVSNSGPPQMFAPAQTPESSHWSEPVHEFPSSLVVPTGRGVGSKASAASSQVPVAE